MSAARTTSAAGYHAHLNLNHGPLRGMTIPVMAELSGMPHSTVSRQMAGCQTNMRCNQRKPDGGIEAQVSAHLAYGLAGALGVNVGDISFPVRNDGRAAKPAAPVARPKAAPKAPEPEKPAPEKAPIGTAKVKKPPEFDADALFRKRKKDPEPHGKRASEADWEAWETRRLLYSGKPMTDARALKIADHAVLAEVLAGVLDTARIGKRTDQIVRQLLAGKRIK